MYIYMTNYIGEELDFLDERQQNAIYDIMNPEAELLEYILDDPDSIGDEIILKIGEDLQERMIIELKGFYKASSKKKI
jgi:hypothetical protein